MFCSQMRLQNQRKQNASGRHRYLPANKWYCVRVSVVVGTVMPTLRQVTGTASELVLL
jgi:hypothetical protein